MSILSGFGFGGEVAKALGLRHTTHITIDIPLDGPVEVSAQMAGTPGLEKVDWSQLKDAEIDITYQSWRDLFEKHDQDLIDHCFTDSAYRAGIPGKDERRVICKMAALLDKIDEMRR